MIVKKDKDSLQVKIRKKMRNGFAPDDYCKVVNIRDTNDMCVLFEDLNALFDVSIETAFRKYMDRKGKSFPF